MPVTDFSTTPGSNTSISGINIAENCPPGNINNAIRQLMADVAGWRTGLVTPAFTSLSAVGSGLTIATARIVGRSTAGAGALEEISIGAGLSLSGGVLSNTVTASSGTVTSVQIAVPSGFAVSGGPITSSGTITISISNAANARTALGAAASGANTDITALDQDVTITATGTIGADTLGYRGIPVVTVAGKTLELSDAGKDVYTSGNVTIPANSSIAFPVGTVLSVTNSSASPVTIGITTDTLRWNAATGTRTLAAYGTATIHKKTATLWFIKGDVS